MRLRARLSIHRGGAPSQVSVSLNGRTAIQVIVQMKPGKRDPVAEELDLIDGHRTLPIRGETLDIDEVNYVQLHSVHGGPNTVTVAEEAFGPKAPLVDATQVLPSSGLYETTTGPAHLTITAPAALRLGNDGRVKLDVTVTDQGLPAREVSAEVATASGTASAAAPRQRYLGDVAPGSPRYVTFVLKGGRSSGSHIRVRVTGSGGSPEADTHLLATAGDAPGGSDVAAIAIIMLPAVLLCAGVVRKSRRTETSRR
jgi:hypothetical protein